MKTVVFVVTADDGFLVNRANFYDRVVGANKTADV